MAALNGGVSATSDGMDFGVIVLSIGPLFSSGPLALQANGITDAPVGWRVTAFNASYPLAATVKLGVLCAAVDDAETVIDSSVTGFFAFGELTVPCPEGKIAIGGGVSSIYDPWYYDRVASSSPDGAASSWVGAYWVEIESAMGGDEFKVAAVCIDERALNVIDIPASVNPELPTFREVPCAAGEIALGGGVYTSEPSYAEGNGYAAVIIDTSPLFEGAQSLNDLADGAHDAPVGWRGMVWNRNDWAGLMAHFYAICWEPERVYLPLIVR
jgi:hypothetical protein